MLSQQTIREILRPCVENKPDMLLTVGIVSPSGTMKFSMDANGTFLQASHQTYEIGSVTKTFVSSIIAFLIREGKVRLEDAVFRDCTLKQFLTHSSGIEEYPFQQIHHENVFSDVLVEDFDAYLENVSIGPKGWEYSNTGFACVGRFLESRMKKPFADILNDFVREKLELQHTHIGHHGAEMYGHDAQSAFKWEWNELSAFLPAGCLCSNLDDMLAYLRMHMTSDTCSICHVVHYETQMPFDMGLGFMVDKSEGIIFSMGLTNGFSSYLAFDPNREFGVVVLSNYAGYGYGAPDTPNGIGKRILQEIKNSTKS